MSQETDRDPRSVYVESLRWRQHDLQGRIEAIGRQIAALTRDDAELKQQLRAVDQLLLAEGEPTVDPERLVVARVSTDVSTGGNGRGTDPDRPSLDFASWGPKSRAIYTAAAEVIREAGVPLHYRVLADEVQKRVALGGNDPGATLIAHLHRAQDVFPRVGRGIYGLHGMIAAAEMDKAAAPAPAARRRKTRRRTR